MGLSSRHGIVPLSHTQDMGGPLARTVVELALMLDATVGGDPEDPATSDGEEHRPASYRDGLASDALRTARIGVVKSLFGSAPEDVEGADVVRRALDAMREGGAAIVDVNVPGLDAMLRGSSVINTEFKFDLKDYLDGYPTAPVHSLAEILERGEYHVALEPVFRQSEAVDRRDNDAHRAALHKRAAVRELIAATFEEHRLDALAYPVLSRKAAVIGEPQRGLNTCQVSASSGFPALSVPAGFTPDGVPIGVELLGAAWTEPRLLAIAYSYEQAVHPRRSPAATPALVNGKRPGLMRSEAVVGDVRVSFLFDPVTGRLSYDASSMLTSVFAAVHRGASGKRGPVVMPVRGGRASTGDVQLQTADREALARGDLYLAVPSRGYDSRTVLQFHRQ
jgi:Asp-tRNA(Asn)/Glu-tRNA(Gln) amidotransferase A subunit family amidase